MSNKREEDVEMNELDKEYSERDGFLQDTATSPSKEDIADGGGLFAQLENSSGAAVLAYCFSSISMTVVNKYVVSGSSWNLNFFYLAIQVGYSLSFCLLLSKSRIIG